MEIRNEILNKIKSDKNYKDIFSAYKKIAQLKIKDPINSYLKIKKLAVVIEKKLKEIAVDKKQGKENGSARSKIEGNIDFKSLDMYTVKELKEICVQQGLQGYSKAKKATLINIIKKQRVSEQATITKYQKAENKDSDIKNNFEDYLKFLYSKIEEWKEQYKRKFSNKLESLFKEHGFELKGHYPNLKASLYSFFIDFDKPKIFLWYGPEQEKIGNSNIDAESLVKEVIEIHNKITTREFNDKKFLGDLYKAYELACFRAGKILGEQAVILDVLLDYIFLIQNNKFKTNPRKDYYLDYTRAYFSFDLYRLKSRMYDSKELSFVIATRAYTKEKSDFLWIPTNDKGDGNYISHIKFKIINND